MITSLGYHDYSEWKSIGHSETNSRIIIPESTVVWNNNQHMFIG